MTVRKGQPWGSLVVPGPGIVIVHTDRELRELVIAARRAAAPLPIVGVVGGDLMRTLGGSADASRFALNEPIPHLPVLLPDRVGSTIQ